MECDIRVRVTLDRSSTGQGRKESVEIWERSLKLTGEELNREVEARLAAGGCKIRREQAR